MAHVLYVMGSPRGAGGSSTRLAAAFLESYRAANPGDTIDTLDVWAEELPPFAAEAADGKLKGMAGMALPANEQAAFDLVLTYIARLKKADKVVLSTGMWNFSVPYRVKHWVDLVVQAGHTFGFDPARGYFGLVTGKPVQLVLATGGDYSEDPMAQADMLTSYLKAVFGFMGFTDIRTVCASCTAYPPDISGPAMERALVAAKAAGTSF